MSTALKTQQGDISLFKFRSGTELLGRQISTPTPFQHGLLYSGSVVRVVVEPDEDARQFAMLWACTVAAGADLGPFAKGPGVKVAYVSGSGGEAEDLRRLRLAFDSLDTEQQNGFSASFSMYHCGMEEDHRMDLTTSAGRLALERSIPSDTKVAFIDYMPALVGEDQIKKREQEKLDSWCNSLSKRGLTVVVFDAEAKKSKMLGEHSAKNTIYLTYDDTAPTELGGGHLIHRRRVDASDTLPKCVSFWFTVIDGKLAYGFSVPDSEDRLAPRLTKFLERQIEIEKMLKEDKSQQFIADELGVHASTICRDLKRIEAMRAKAVGAD
jgi:hypothetical protein